MSIAAFEPTHPHQPANTLAPEVRGMVRAEVFTDFGSAGAVWNDLLQAGHATPYQRQDWIEGYFRHVEQPAGHRAALIVLRDRTEVAQALLPLVIQTTGPFRIARFIGGKHANFNMPVFGKNPEFLSAEVLYAGLKQAAVAAGIDAFALTAQPCTWQGLANPMRLMGGQPSPGAGHKLTLEADGEALLKSRLSKDARKKLRQKEAKLAQIGPVTYHRPKTTCEARAVLDDFLRLKSARFEAQGIDDPFASAEIRAFLGEAVTNSVVSGNPPVELHALKAGERTVAIYGGVRDSTRFCGLFTAFDADPDIARSSPGDILLMLMVRQACADGLTTFDLGVGEARYKAQICDQREELFDSYIPVTMKGRLIAAALSVATTAKRRAKASPLANGLVGRLRRMRAKAG